MKPEFYHSTLVDVIYDDMYILAPGQAVPVWENNGLFQKVLHDVQLHARDVVTYMDRKDPKRVESYLLNEEHGDSCYMPFETCLTKDRPFGRTKLGYECCHRFYTVMKDGAIQRNKKSLFPFEVANDLIRSRCIKGCTGSITNKVSDFGAILPVMMTPMNPTIEKNETLSDFAIDMHVPGTGVMKMIEIPIPIILTPYEEGIYILNHNTGASYTDEDIAKHEKIWHKLVNKFLAKYKIREVYIGLPNEGTSLYDTLDDADRKFEPKDYDTYSMFCPFRLVHVSPWNHHDRWAAVDGSRRARLYKAIASGKLDFEALI